MSDHRPRALGVVVTVAEVVTLLAVALFVVMLFANEPDGAGTATVASGADGGNDAGAGGGIDGAAVYAQRCAVCHGASGEGGVGPTLAGGAVVEAFPDAADQIAVVTEGRGGMPDFGTALSPEEIDAVVRYTRSL